MKYEKDNLYYDTSDIIIIARAAVRRRGPFLPDFHIEDPDTAAGDRLRPDRILDLYPDI